MQNFVQGDRNQPYLLPPDLREWLPEDDLAHFVVAAVERVPLSHFRVNGRGTGSAQYHPQMMLALLIYCYANGIFSSRRIERATYRDIGVRYVTANTHPDHDTVCKFRRENLEAVHESFVQVLLLAKLAQAEHRASYRVRQHTVEPVFGIMKHAMGFRHFLLRGHDKVTGEWQLLALAYNCKRLHNLQLA